MTLVMMTSANLRALQHDNNSVDADDVILGGQQQCKKRNTGGCNTMRPQTTNRDIMMHTFTLDIVLEAQIPQNSDELCQLFVSSPKIQIQIPKRWWVMSIVRTNLADDGSQIWRWFADWQPSSFDRELDREKSQKKTQKGKHPQKIYKCHTNTLVLARTESTNTDIVSITQTHLCSDRGKKS